MFTTKFILHYSLHLLVPLFFSYFFFKGNWKKIYFIFLASMLIDVDHLLANPIFDSNRCSINFHPLHTYYAAALYVIGLFFRKTHILAFALIFHLLTDFIDCYF